MCSVYVHRYVTASDLHWLSARGSIPFLPPFIVLGVLSMLCSSSLLRSISGCKISRCWWIAVKGSSWNCGLFSTAFSWADSRSLENKLGFHDSELSEKGRKNWSKETKNVQRELQTCIDLQFSFASTFCSDTVVSGRSSPSNDISYAFSFFWRLRLLCFFFCKLIKIISMHVNFGTGMYVMQIGTPLLSNSNNMNAHRRNKCFC
jgi:hypothetical protein